MIQPNELRIGNNIFNGVIVAVNEDHFIFNDGYSNWSSKRFNSEVLAPIPITPEILERLGFQKHPHFTVANSRFIELGRNRVLSVECAGTQNEIVFLSEQSDKAVKDIICIRNYDYDGYTYVHQLQNLFYALTNKELTFKTN
jgi:hypothetical protein